MQRKISPKFHVKNGVKNGKFHANFTLPGRSAELPSDMKSLRMLFPEIFSVFLREFAPSKSPGMTDFWKKSRVNS